MATFYKLLKENGEYLLTEAGDFILLENYSYTNVNKTLKYTCLEATGIQKSLKYCVETTPTKETKSLKYDIFLGLTKIEKGLIYKTLPSINVEKTLEYCVIQTPSAETKSLKYTTVSTPSVETKSLKYDIFLVATNIQKSLQYSIDLGLPYVTTQAVDTIEKTTATGHGTIVS